MKLKHTQAKNMTCRFDDEEHLIEMAMEAMGA